MSVGSAAREGVRFLAYVASGTFEALAFFMVGVGLFRSPGWNWAFVAVAAGVAITALTRKLTGVGTRSMTLVVVVASVLVFAWEPSPFSVQPPLPWLTGPLMLAIAGAVIARFISLARHATHGGAPLRAWIAWLAGAWTCWPQMEVLARLLSPIPDSMLFTVVAGWALVLVAFRDREDPSDEPSRPSEPRRGVAVLLTLATVGIAGFAWMGMVDAALSASRSRLLAVHTGRMAGTVLGIAALAAIAIARLASTHRVEQSSRLAKRAAIVATTWCAGLACVRWLAPNDWTSTLRDVLFEDRSTTYWRSFVLCAIPMGVPAACAGIVAALVPRYGMRGDRAVVLTCVAFVVTGCLWSWLRPDSDPRTFIWSALLAASASAAAALSLHRAGRTSARRANPEG